MFTLILAEALILALLVVLGFSVLRWHEKRSATRSVARRRTRSLQTSGLSESNGVPGIIVEGVE